MCHVNVLVPYLKEKKMEIKDKTMLDSYHKTQDEYTRLFVMLTLFHSRKKKDIINDL